MDYCGLTVADAPPEADAEADPPLRSALAPPATVALPLACTFGAEALAEATAFPVVCLVAPTVAAACPRT